MRTRLLDPAAFRATLVPPLRQVTARERAVVDVWPYIEAIPDADLAPFTIAGNDVERIYRAHGDGFDHVLVPTATPTAYLVIVVELATGAVLGHHVLYVNELYGLPPPGLARR